MNINTDYFSYNGAHLLKRAIEAYWAKRGLFPVVRVERERVTVGHDELRPVWVVRSNLAFTDQGQIYVRAA
jgi:hypothetical protein